MNLSLLDRPFWSQDAAAVGAALKCELSGLSSESAADLLRTAGPNVVADTQHLSAFRLLLRQFESPLVLILIFGAVIALGLKEWVDCAIILSIVFGSTMLGFFQEFRASRAVEALRRRLQLTCRALRDGCAQTIPVSAIVPGDLVLLSAGNLVPADGLVIEAQDFLVNEASMTGESFPVEKRPGIVAETAPVSARTNAVFLGSSVRSGTARVLVVKTGRRTAFADIAARLQAREQETDFARGMRHFGYLLLRVMVLIILFVLTVNLLLHRPLIDSLLFAVALAVGLSPELLPAIVSVTLSVGARGMSERGVIVRRLEAIENLGSMDVLCTDKTGTLTEGKVVLQDATDAQDRFSRDVLRLGFLNALFETGIENPLDAALTAAGEREHLTAGGTRKVDEIPYDFLRRRLTIVLTEEKAENQHLIVTKGAFTNVLDVCSSLEHDAETIELTGRLRAELEEIFRAKGASGFRVLAVATRQVPAKEKYGHGDEQNMTFRGFLTFLDPPKRDARATITDLARLGIRTKIISGDNRYVTAYLAKEVGLDPKSLLTGEDLKKLKDEALWHLAPRTDLFAEIDPQQKERIVRSLQRAGHSVGYLGDGINDAPALYAADVGISVEGAVDVARESADIILLKPDLGILRLGIEEGRRAFANTLKYISITTSANFGNMVSMALATPLLPFLPLVAKQILLNNLLSDVPSIAIAGDNVDASAIRGPTRWNIREIQRFMITFGLISSLFDLVTFATLLLVFHANEATFQTAWFIISVLTELAVVLILRTHGPALRSKPGRLLLWSTVMVTAAIFAIPYLGGLTSLFGFIPLSALQIALSIAIVAAYIGATEFAKTWFYGARNNKAAGN